VELAGDSGSVPEATGRFLSRLQARRADAETAGNARAAARLSAMEAVVRTGFIPLACPDAVLVAGDAADALVCGRTEDEWYAEQHASRSGVRGGPRNLDAAIRILKSAGLWPWSTGH
jgi:hypothetical protein